MAIIELSMVVSAIVEMNVEAIAKKLGRHEAVLKTLRRLKFDIEVPADNFDAIYAHTLIEYGIFKPEPILNFFRYEFIRKAFRDAFYKNNLNILEREAEETIQWNRETGKLGHIDYGPRREFASFSAVFHQIVDNTRTPVEVKQDQKLDDIHQKIDKILERLSHLNALEDIRSELSRISLENQQQSAIRTSGITFEQHNISHTLDTSQASPIPNFRHRSDFVGRKKEIKEFRSLINRFQKIQENKTKFPTVLLISGEGGIGKSWLVNELCAIAEDKDIAVLKLSFDLAISFDNERLPESLLGSIVQQAKELGLKDAFTRYDALRLKLLESDLQIREARNTLRLSTKSGQILVSAGLDPGAEYQMGYLGPKIIDQLAKEVIRGLNKAASEKPILLVIDGYEKAGEVDRWLRTQLSLLEGRITILITSQRDIETELIGSFNRLSVQHWKLSSLLAEDIVKYLQISQVANAPTIAKSVMQVSQGIPLAIAVCTTSIIKSDKPIDLNSWEGNELKHETVERVARYWLRELPKADRDILFVMSILRYFNDECLNEVLQREITILDYSTIYPFITLHKLGWEVHDRVRRFIIAYLKRNRLDYYIEMNTRAEKYWDKQLVGFEQRLEPRMYALSLEWGNAVTTKLYHLIQIDEENGLAFLMEKFWEGVKLRFFFSSLVEVLGNEEISLDSRFAKTWQATTLLQSLILAARNEDKSALQNALEESITLTYIPSRRKKHIGDLMKDLRQGLNDLAVVKGSKCD